MAANTSIEWTATVHPDGTVTPGKTWNPVTGCTKVSPGCAHCYAEGVANRFWLSRYPVMQFPGEDGTRSRKFTDVMTHEDRLLEPLSWRKPARVFVNSMSDLFHEDVPFAFVDKVFAVMASAPQHTFQILTKRPQRMLEYMGLASRSKRVSVVAGEREFYSGRWALADCVKLAQGIRSRWPLPNVWLGVSVENQHFADERIPLLLQTPAAVRFISAEPLLGPVDLVRGGWTFLEPLSPPPGNKRGHQRGLDWVIVGGESGHGARPFDLAWARSIVQQCKAAGVACFVKQLGAKPRDEVNAETRGFDTKHKWRPMIAGVPINSRKGGDPSEWPEDLRVRQFPEVRQ